MICACFIQIKLSLRMISQVWVYYLWMINRQIRSILNLSLMLRFSKRIILERTLQLEIFPTICLRRVFLWLRELPWKFYQLWRSWVIDWQDLLVRKDFKHSNKQLMALWILILLTIRLIRKLWITRSKKRLQIKTKDC
jgi:hypothetical protein